MCDRMVLFVKQGMALFILCIGLTACVTAPPTHTEDLCSIYREKRAWYHAAMRQEIKWNIPSSVPMAIMNQESSFRGNVHTRRAHILWIIPWGYITTAYGYPQAKNEVWRDYKRQTGATGRRDNFAEALNFINWYITNTRRLDNVSVQDGMRQYLAYHEGWNGYRRQTYVSKKWLIKVAQKVGKRSKIYQRQFNACKSNLEGDLLDNVLDSTF